MINDTASSSSQRIAHAPRELANPGSLFAAIPALVGFQPTDSVVLIALYDGAILLTTHHTLPSSGDQAFAATLARTATGFQDAHFVACIVGDNGEDHAHELLAAHLLAAFARNLREVEVYGVPRITVGARWFQYATDTGGGVLSDPAGSQLSLVAARNQVAYPSHEALAAALEPDSREVLKRRDALMDAALEHMSDHQGDGEQQTRALFDLVQREVERAEHRTVPLTDDEIAQLAIALSDLQVRDRCLAYAVGEHAAAAERLWTELTRTVPVPERAEPATLLALFAYARGNGTLAVIALNHAENAAPRHRLATLTRIALENGAPPSLVRDLAERSRHLSGPESDSHERDA